MRYIPSPALRDRMALLEKMSRDIHLLAIAVAHEAAQEPVTDETIATMMAIKNQTGQLRHLLGRVTH